jgi:TldD protein
LPGLTVILSSPSASRLKEIADTRRIEIMERANQAALDYDPRIKMAKIDYYDQVRGRVIANSEGLYLRDELPLMFFIVETMSVDGNSRHMSRERISQHSGFEMFEKYTPEYVAERAAREAIAMLDAEDAPAGMMDVVMENGWGGVLIHEAVGHPLEADNIAKGIGALPVNWARKWQLRILQWLMTGPSPICGARSISTTRVLPRSVMC